MPAIYTVTTIRYLSDFPTARTVGWFTTLENACKVVDNNVGDIYEEGYYNWVVIERIEPGLYEHDHNPLWYRWNRKEEKYLPVEETPVQALHIVGWAMG